MWIGIIEQRQIISTSLYTFEISAVPKFYVAGSIVVITGQITDNGSGFASEDFTFSANFDFGIPPQPVAFSADTGGFFLVTLPVRNDLTHPDTGLLTITNTLFDTEEVVFAIETTPPPIPGYSFSVPDNLNVYGEYTITGSAPSGTNFTLTSGGIFPTQNIIADAAGNWTYSFAVPNTVSPGSYDFVVSSGLGTLTETRTVDLIGFNPVFTSFNPNAVGILTSINPNSKTVDPQTELAFELLVSGLVYDYQELVADNSGSFSFNSLTLPLSLAAATATARFTRAFPLPSVVVEATITLPDFDPTITYDFPDDPLYTADSYGVAVTITSGYSPTIKIFDPSSNLITSTSSGFNLAIDSPEGIYTFEISAPNHDPVTFTKNVLTGFLADLINQNRLLFPGDSHFISISGKPGETVNFNVFGNNYTGTLDVNGELLQEIIIPAGTFGSNLCLVSSSYYPNAKAVGLFVDNPADYALSFPDPGLIFTNSSSSLTLSGLLLPSKEATITIPELGVSQTIVGDDRGAFNFSLNPPWQPSGTYNLTVTSPGETTINYSGSHRPELQITPNSINVNPGDPSGSFQIRGDANEDLIVSIEPLVAETTITTDSSGYYDLIYPAINSSIVEDISYVAKAKTADLLYQVAASLNVNYDPIQLTLDITNPESTGLLFTNSTYNISGSKPDIEAFSLSNIGSIDSLNIVNKSGTTYEADLTTNENTGTISLIAAVLGQPSLSKSFVVDYPLILTVPNGTLTYGDAIVVSAVSDPEVLVTLVVNYADNNGAIVFSETYNQATIAPTGEASFNLTINDIPAATEISFIGKISNNYSLEEIRSYESLFGLSTGFPATESDFQVLLSGFNFETRILSNLAQNLAKFYLWNLGFINRNTFIDSEIQKSGNYLSARPGISPTNNRMFLKNFSGDYSFLESNNGFTIFYSLVHDYNGTRLDHPGFYLLSNSDKFRLYVGSSFIETRVLTRNILYDFCLTYLKNDPDNSNNSTIKLYINGVLELDYQLGSVLNMPSSSDLFKLTNSTYFISNFYLLTRPFTPSEVANSYFNSIRRKFRRFTIEDFAKSCAYSLIPGINPGYFEGTTNQFNVIPTTTESSSGRFFLETSLPILEDGQNRKFYNLDSQNLKGGTFSLGQEHLFICKRKAVNSIKQVFFDCRRSSGALQAFELAFTGLDSITLTVNQGSSYERATFSNSVIQSFDFLIVYYEVNATTPILYVNGIELNSTFSSIADPGNLTNESNKICVGSKLEDFDYCSCDFYGYLNIWGFEASESIDRFFSSIAEKAAYYAWCAGFKEAMENVNPSFPLLSQYDGFYHL